MQLRIGTALLASLMVLAGCSSSGDDSAPATTTATTRPITVDSACEGRSRHVVVVGIDGVRSDALEVADTPAIDSLIDAGTSTMMAYAGGEIGTETEQPTVSGPGWATIVTGVWANDHDVLDNEFATWDLGAPHFFERIRAQDPDARLDTIQQWIPIRVLAGDTADVDEIGSGDFVSEVAVREVTEEDPTVVFLHLDDVDHAGHADGYSPEIDGYTAAIEGVDAQIAPILAAIESRPNRDDECWATIVVTDHGGIDQGHGGQSDEERTIPLIVAGDGIEAEVVADGPGHNVLPPTVLAYLGLDIDPAWGWDDPFGVKTAS